MVFEEEEAVIVSGCNVPSIHSLTEDAGDIIRSLVFSAVKWVE